jgi:hypothetical protein
MKEQPEYEELGSFLFERFPALRTLLHPQANLDVLTRTRLIVGSSQKSYARRGAEMRSRAGVESHLPFLRSRSPDGARRQKRNRAAGAARFGDNFKQQLMQPHSK